MASALSAERVAQYEGDGFLTPLDGLSRDEAAGLLAKLEQAERADGGRLTKAHNQKSHLIYPWIADLVRRPEILDPVESVLGPDILLWGCGFFSKDSGDGKIVSWHQDST
jgi:non-haem Fe2+, alpha-ketoglutarate-dependent halogenase